MDALTRSGPLSLDSTSLHIIVPTTHRFDQTLMDTVIQKNENPITKVEKSLLIVASTIHQEEIPKLTDGSILGKKRPLTLE